jgi:hypothetical protein
LHFWLENTPSRNPDKKLFIIRRVLKIPVANPTTAIYNARDLKSYNAMRLKNLQTP